MIVLLLLFAFLSAGASALFQRAKSTAARPEASSLDPGVEMPKCDFDPGKYDVSFFTD